MLINTQIHMCGLKWNYMYDAYMYTFTVLLLNCIYLHVYLCMHTKTLKLYTIKLL